MLKPAQLRLLLAIAESGQLFQAADAVGMTQPAASRMLAEIERQLGAALFQRQPRGMVPTEIGLMVIDRAGIVLRELGGMVEQLQSLRDGLSGSVRVGSVTGPAVSILVSAIREVKRVAPTSDINIDVLPSRDLLPHLVAGEMDFVLARTLPEFDSRDFVIHPMLEEHVRIIARSGHPLSGSTPVTVEELRRCEWIMQQRGAPIREATLAAFAAIGLAEPTNVVNTPSTLLTLAYLAQSDAVAPVSREVADLLIQAPVSANYVELPLATDIRVAPYYLLHLQRRPLSPFAERLWRLVGSMAQVEASRSETVSSALASTE